MKLPIKKTWFDKIKNGDKHNEIRDAHLTLVCEETGETLRVDVLSTHIIPRSKTRSILGDPPGFNDMFEDDSQILFVLRGD